MRFVKNLFSVLHLFLLWAVISALLWGWAFTFVTDTSPAKKVTVYCYVPAVEDRALAAELEKTMPQGLRMIKVHPFSYVMFGSVADGDVYILPASEIERFAADLSPVEGVFGVKVYDAAAGTGAAAGYIRYGEEDYYLFLGAASPHLEDGKALAVAKALLALGPEGGLPEDFILGVDASCVIAEEASGVRYYSFAGKEQDVFATLAENGVTHIRVRVWNHPYDDEGRGFGGGNCDIDKAVAIGRRASACGMKLILDLHYSDFWADPSKQKAPAAWEGMDLAKKSEALYAYTKECLQRLTAAGVQVAMVQLGNETNGAMCGETTWPGVIALMKAGSRAVRECCPEAQTAVHFTNPERPGAYRDYARRLAEAGLDYDVFASSYYPYWHGSLENLSALLAQVGETWGKKVMVMETSYPYTAADTDHFGNTVGEGTAGAWPFTQQGQADALRAVIDTVARTKHGVGVVYWEGTWISVGGASYEENAALWEAHGSGWASSFAAVYDPDDAGKYYGGCGVDNQALFDERGRPLPALRVFRQVRGGGEGAGPTK